MNGQKEICICWKSPENAASVKSSLDSPTLDFPIPVVITFIGHNRDSSHDHLVINIQ